MADLHENEHKELLNQVAAGSENAFSRLFYLYNDKLYSFIYSISGSKQLAEDTVQEIFLKIWEKRSEASTINHFDSYLFRMARNHALNAFRRMSKESVILEKMGQQPAEFQECNNDIEYREMERSIKEAIEKLPNKQKQVFVLSRDHGLKQAEISHILHITVPTVKSHITQAIHFIRKECKNIYQVTKIMLILATSFIY